MGIKGQDPSQPLTEEQLAAIEHFIELDKAYTDVKAFLEVYRVAKERVAAVVTMDGYFQDDEGTVYKVTEPRGRFVYYEKIDVVRTRRDGEEKGELSLKEAQAAGFEPANAAKRSKKPDVSVEP